MKHKKQILVILLFLMSMWSYSQINNIMWQQCFITDSMDTESYCIENFNNGFIVGIHVLEGGDGVSNYHGNGDSWFIHLDSLGNIIWERCFGGSGGEQPLKIVPIDDQYYYLVNGSTSTDGDVNCENHGGTDVWIVKIDTTGEIIWQGCYGGPDYERPRDAILTADGGLLIMTRIYDKGGDISTYYGGYDNWLCKIDSVGNLQWETTIGSPGLDNGHRLLLTSGNTYLALCSVNENGGMSTCEMMNDPFSGLDLWLVELDLDGNILRQDCYGGSLNDLGYDMVETFDGYVLLSKTESFDHDVSHNNGLSDFWLLKINKDRDIIWENSLGGSNNEIPRFLSQTSDNGYILVGSSSSNNHDVNGNHSIGGRSDIWIVKTDSTGELVWQQCFGSAGGELLWGHFTVAKKNDYNFVLAPITNGYTFDVNCNMGLSRNRNWVFQIKDCSKFQPTIPQQPTGKDTLCVNTDSITTYTTTPATNAWYYEWEIQPEEAGTTLNDSITTTVNWNPNYEGPATLKVRSLNDCGTSAWSDNLVIQTYMCLGTEENPDQNTFRVYPNPTSNTLIIETDNNTNKPYIIEIYNTLGYKVFGIRAIGNITSINVGDWAKGIYFVRANVGSFVYSRKILVK